MSHDTPKLTTKQGRHKNPTGVHKRPVAVRLLPEERRQLEDLAAAAKLTEAAIVRRIYLLGVPAWLATQPND